MTNFSMTCTCGDTMTVPATTREEAVGKLKGMMTVDAVAQHMAQKHPGQPVPPVSQVHGMIEQTVRVA